VVSCLLIPPTTLSCHHHHCAHTYTRLRLSSFRANYSSTHLSLPFLHFNPLSSERAGMLRRRRVRVARMCGQGRKYMRPMVEDVTTDGSFFFVVDGAVESTWPPKTNRDRLLLANNERLPTCSRTTAMVGQESKRSTLESNQHIPPLPPPPQQLLQSAASVCYTMFT